MLAQDGSGVAVERMLSWTRLALLALAVWLVLTNAVVWAGARWGTWHAAHFDVPIAPGRSIHVHVGDRFTWRYLGMDADHVMPRQVFRPLRIAIRYRVHPGWGGRQLVHAYLPTWPMLPLTFAVGAATLLAYWPGQLLRRQRR